MRSANFKCVPECQVNVRCGQKEATVTDKRFIQRIVIAAIGKCIPNRPESKCTTGTIEQAPEKYVLYILLADGAGAQHGKADLHEVDECTGEEKVEGVNARLEIGCRLITFTSNASECGSGDTKKKDEKRMINDGKRQARTVAGV